MKELFEVAAGSVIGRDHLLAGKNNQDAYCAVRSEQATIAVVCDGSGSGRHSEVGAKLGARLVVNTIVQFLTFKSVDPPDTFLEQVRQEVLVPFQALSELMGDNFSQIVNDYYLFTIVGAMLTPAGAVLFSLGDGVIIVNGEAISLASSPDNASPYLAYSLVNPESEQWKFQVHQQLPIDEVESILIGTDGVNHLIQSANQKLPGKSEAVGEIAQFWQDDRYFTNPDMANRRLAFINQEVAQPDWQNQQIVKSHGLLPNDTTLITIRKRKYSNPI